MDADCINEATFELARAEPRARGKIPDSDTAIAGDHKICDAADVGGGMTSECATEQNRIGEINAFGKSVEITELLLHGGDGGTEHGSCVEVTIAQLLCRHSEELIKASRLEHDVEAMYPAMQLEVYARIGLHPHKDASGTSYGFGLIRVVGGDGITELELEHSCRARRHRMHDGRTGDMSLALAVEANVCFQPAGRCCKANAVHRGELDPDS